MDNPQPSPETKPGVSDINPPSPQVVPGESPIDKAEKLIKTLDEATRRFEDIAKKNEDTLGRIMLSGRAEAGQKTTSPEEERAKYVAEETAKTMKRWGYSK